jgi:hypothetical protein
MFCPSFGSEIIHPLDGADRPYMRRDVRGSLHAAIHLGLSTLSNRSAVAVETPDQHPLGVIEQEM